MTFSLFASRKTEINVSINSINDEIALLQQQLQQQQQFLQEIGTVEQAGESALAQARTFLTMVRAIDPSQETVFWNAMDALKMVDQDALPEGLDDSPTPEYNNEPLIDEDLEIEGEPSPNLGGWIDAVSEALDVEAVEIEMEEGLDETPNKSVSGDTNTVEDAVAPLTPPEIKALDWVTLRQIATSLNITNPSGQRLTRKFVEKVLSTGIITALDVTAAKAEINKQAQGYSF